METAEPQRIIGPPRVGVDVVATTRLGRVLAAGAGADAGGDVGASADAAGTADGTEVAEEGVALDAHVDDKGRADACVPVSI